MLFFTASAIWSSVRATKLLKLAWYESASVAIPSGVLVSNPGGPPMVIWSATAPRSVSVPRVCASTTAWLQAMTCFTSALEESPMDSAGGSKARMTVT